MLGHRDQPLNLNIDQPHPNKALEKIKKGEFREDFFYRLNVLPIHLPPLREHREDIPLIVNHLLGKHCRKMNKPNMKVSAELLDVFINRDWEGNVREMENLIMQGILFSNGNEILPRDVGLRDEARTPCLVDSSFQNLPYKEAKEQTLKSFNTKYINTLLTGSKGNVTQAAKICGLERQALQQVMRRYGIKADPFRDQK